MTVSDDLVRSAQQGNNAAFEEIASCYRQKILATAYRLVSSVDDVEDIAQDVLLRIYVSLPRLKRPEHLSTWIYRLTVNVAYDFLRKRKRTMEVLMADVLDDTLSNAVALASVNELHARRERSQLQSETKRVLAKISPEDRELLLLREFEGLTLKELGRWLDCDQNTAGVRLFRARQRALQAHNNSLRRLNTSVPASTTGSETNAVPI